MVTDAKRIRIFLSSPSDISAERTIIKSVCEDLSHDLGGISNFFIELVRWETHSFSAIGESPQGTINEQIGQDYDIFLGMLGKRFGTPTKEYGSGTEEEFNLAVSRYKKTGSPEIMFFFLEGTVDLAELDANQLARVQEFRRSLPETGLLYANFSSEMSLYRLAHSHIQRSAMKVLSKADSVAAGEKNSALSMTFDPLAEWQALLVQDSEVNASVLLQMATDQIMNTISNITQLNKTTSAMIKDLRQGTSALNQVSITSHPSKAAKAIERLVASVRSTNRQYLETVPKFHDSLMKSMSFTQRSISIFTARGEMTAELGQAVLVPLTQFRETLERLSETFEQTDSGLAADHLPGSAFSVEQKKLRALIKDLRRVVDDGVREMRAVESMLLV